MKKACENHITESIYYDVNIDKLYTFLDIKKMYEEATENEASEKDVIEFINNNHIHNGGSLYEVEMSDLIEDAENGYEEAIDFIKRLSQGGMKQ